MDGLGQLKRLSPIKIHKYVVSGCGSKNMEKLMERMKRKVAGK